MRYSWENRSEQDDLVITLVNELLREKLRRIVDCIQSEERENGEEFEFFADIDWDISIIFELLEVDVEWLFGLVCRQSGDQPLLGGCLTDLLPKDYSFAVRLETICDEETTPCLTCRPRSFIYITKAA